MSTHNICICREIRKILCGYPLLSVAMRDFTIHALECFIDYNYPICYLFTIKNINCQVMFGLNSNYTQN